MRRNRSNRRRSGAILIKMAFFLFLLLTFAALAIDLGFFYSQQAELQVAGSAAAAGAALDLPDDAVSTAVRLAEENLPPSAHGNVLASSDVEVGRWDKTTRTFTPNGTPPNAVRVTARKSAANGNVAPWIVGSVFGLTSLDLSASATAVLLPEFYGAVSSSGSISVTGSGSIDSYDSSEGPYDPETAGSDGNVATDGDVSVSGSGTINGDVTGGTVSSGGNATITGSSSPPRRPLEFPPVDTTAIEADNDNESLPLYEKGNKLVSPLDEQRNFELSGGVQYEIPPGEYYFNDLTLSGQASLVVSGRTIIYLTGDLKTSGGDVINSTQDPNNLLIFMTGSTATINASVDWYGVLYAPNTDVTINGSGDVYGAIIGQNVDLGGTGDIHFDTSLSISGEIEGVVKRSAIVD